MDFLVCFLFGSEQCVDLLQKFYYYIRYGNTTTTTRTVTIPTTTSKAPLTPTPTYTKRVQTIAPSLARIITSIFDDKDNEFFRFFVIIIINHNNNSAIKTNNSYV